MCAASLVDISPNGATFYPNSCEKQESLVDDRHVLFVLCARRQLTTCQRGLGERASRNRRGKARPRPGGNASLPPHPPCARRRKNRFSILMVEAATKEAPASIAGGRDGTRHFSRSKPILVAFSVVDRWRSLLMKSSLLARRRP